MRSQFNTSAHPGDLSVEAGHLQKSWTLSHGLFAATLVVGFCFLALYNYLAFHILAEMFSIVVAAALFLLVWHGRRFISRENRIGHYFSPGTVFHVVAKATFILTFRLRI